MRAWAGLLLLCACGSFAASKDVPEETTDAGPTKKPKDAGVDAASAHDAGPSCATVIEQSFGQAMLGGWTSKGGNASLGVGNGPDGTPSLEAAIAVAPGAGATHVTERSVEGLAPVSGKASFDFAYATLNPTSAVGCAFGLTSKAPFAEARILLEREESGLSAVGGFSNENGAVNELEAHAPVADPGAQTWVRVTFELAVDSNGLVTRSATVGTASVSLPSFTPPTPVVFDGVHLSCGLIGLGASASGPGAQVDFYVKDLVVETCKAPPP